MPEAPQKPSVLKALLGVAMIIPLLFVIVCGVVVLIGLAVLLWIVAGAMLHTFFGR